MRKTMINALGKTKLSVRGIEFGGSALTEGQQRGSDYVKVSYSRLTERVNPTNGLKEEVAVSEHDITFNGQFKDEEFKEALLYFKQLVVKIIQECNNDLKSDIDEAIDKINAGK